MKLIKDSYTELLGLTQLFLLREHSLKDIKMVDPTIVDFFQKRAKESPLTTPKKIHSAPLSEEVIDIQAQTPKFSHPTPAPVITATTSLTPSPKPTEKPHSEPSRQQQQQQQLNPIIPSESEPTPPLQATLVPEKKGKNKAFSLEPLPAVTAEDASEKWKLYQSIFPNWNLIKTVPSDDFAQKNKNAWLKAQEISPVMILSFHDNANQLAFLKNIAQAISLRLAPAHVVSASHIEKENGWENILHSPHLRLVIAGDYGLYLNPKLMHFYTENPQQGKHFLHHTPLLLLSDLALYLKEPQLKPLLWRAICNEFATSQLQSAK